MARRQTARVEELHKAAEALIVRIAVVEELRARHMGGSSGTSLLQSLVVNQVGPVRRRRAAQALAKRITVAAHNGADALDEEYRGLEDVVDLGALVESSDPNTIDEAPLLSDELSAFRGAMGRYVYIDLAQAAFELLLEAELSRSAVPAGSIQM